ncbi:hypothetical protein [Anaerorhabdus sp.]|uniref:hypothetical protein n=1 Tax=Anaerorhabdus sp. TaxID=1872524 RepID=UPI002FCC7C15
MELKDIQDLIHSDEIARKDVDGAHQRKYDLKQKIANEKKHISDEAWEQVKREVDQIKKELDEGIQKATEDNNKEFKDVSSRIQQVYQTKKDEWCETIIKHCLD